MGWLRMPMRTPLRCAQVAMLGLPVDTVLTIRIRWEQVRLSSSLAGLPARARCCAWKKAREAEGRCLCLPTHGNNHLPPDATGASTPP